MSDLIQINENISYLPASNRPLSCDIVFIKTDKCTWIFDVGMCKKAADLIDEVTGPKKIVLSHFHPDHTLNLAKVSYDELFVSANTKKYTFKGTVVKEPLTFNENPLIQIFEVPSSHAKGCLCLVCGDYAFMGDGTYCKERIHHHCYNTQLLKAEIDFLETLNCKYVCLDHDPNFIQERLEVIKLHKEIFARRKPGEPNISVEDFFNSDGSVKR